MKVLAIAGSLRTTSSNAALLRAGARLAPAGTEVALYEGLADLPWFSPDLDVDPLPAPIAALRGLITTVDALVISSPEYAHGIPGALKNGLDWLVSATEPLGKPWLLISASPSGAPFAHAHLLEVVRTMATHVIDGGGHVFSRAHLGADGEVTSPALLGAFETGFRQLAEAAARLQAENA